MNALKECFFAAKHKPISDDDLQFNCDHRPLRRHIQPVNHLETKAIRELAYPLWLKRRARQMDVSWAPPQDLYQPSHKRSRFLCPAYCENEPKQKPDPKPLSSPSPVQNPASETHREPRNTAGNDARRPAALQISSPAKSPRFADVQARRRAASQRPLSRGESEKTAFPRSRWRRFCDISINGLQSLKRGLHA